MGKNKMVEEEQEESEMIEEKEHVQYNRVQVSDFVVTSTTESLIDCCNCLQALIDKNVIPIRKREREKRFRESMFG
jgi:hypothetical protein